MQALIKAGAKLNDNDNSKGATPLHLAVQKQRRDVVKVSAYALLRVCLCVLRVDVLLGERVYQGAPTSTIIIIPCVRTHDVVTEVFSI